MELQVTIMLADYAQVTNGKLTLVGAGWNVTNPGPCQMGLGLLVEVPWDVRDHRHVGQVALVDADGHPFIDPAGNPVQFALTLENVRPTEEHAIGTPIVVPWAGNLAGLPLPPGCRLEWQATFDGELAGRAAFNVRAEPLRRAG